MESFTAFGGKGTNTFCCTILEIVEVTHLPKRSVPCQYICRRHCMHGAARSNCAWLVPETERLQDAAAGIHAGLFMRKNAARTGILDNDM